MVVNFLVNVLLREICQLKVIYMMVRFENVLSIVLVIKGLFAKFQVAHHAAMTIP